MVARSSSRLKGDDYQHLFAWSLALELLGEGRQDDFARLEKSEDGSADDVVYVPSPRLRLPIRFHQVKGHVDYRKSYSLQGLQAGEGGRPSLLQKLAMTFHTVRATTECGVEIALVSNWPWSDGDALGGYVDAFAEGRLKQEFFENGVNQSRRIREEIAAHLGWGQPACDDLLRSLRFKVGCSPDSVIKLVEKQMALAQMNAGEDGRALGISVVRQWIKDKVPKVDRTAVLDAARRFRMYDRHAGESAVLDMHLQTYKDDALGGEPAFTFDWYSSFAGGVSPAPAVWDDDLLPAMQEAQVTSSAASPFRSIRMSGRFHLSAGVLAGYSFRHTTGFRLLVQQREEFWRTQECTGDAIPLLEEVVVAAVTPSDLVVTVGIMQDVTAAVRRYCDEQGMLTRHQVHFRPATGYGHKAVLDGQHAMEMAYQIAGRLRDLRQVMSPARVHLFLAVPQALAVFVGYRMNKCGPIQLYEFDSRTYAPSCTLPG